MTWLGGLCARARSAAWLLLGVMTGCHGGDVRPPPDFPPDEYAAVTTTDTTPPWVGANYTHHAFRRCDRVPFLARRPRHP